MHRSYTLSIAAFVFCNCSVRKHPTPTASTVGFDIRLKRHLYLNNGRYGCHAPGRQHCPVVRNRDLGQRTTCARICTPSFTSADVCYSTTCPSSTGAYPQPNFVFNIGSFILDPYNIVSARVFRRPRFPCRSLEISPSWPHRRRFRQAPVVRLSTRARIRAAPPATFTSSMRMEVPLRLSRHRWNRRQRIPYRSSDRSAGNRDLRHLGFTNLGPNEFLTTTPEPGSLFLIALAGVALICIGRKPGSLSRGKERLEA